MGGWNDLFKADFSGNAPNSVAAISLRMSSLQSSRNHSSVENG